MKKLIPKIIGFYLNSLAIAAPGKAASQGFNLFCRPFRGKLTPTHHQFLSSADQFSLAYKGVTIQGYAWGKGAKKVLFLHGWQSHTYRWKNYIEALDKNEFTIYAFDAPGHGLSTGNFLHIPLYSEIVKLVISKVGSMDSIVSHSIGGFTALYALHEYPELSPEKLIVMAPPGEATDFFSVYTKTLGLSTKSVDLLKQAFVKETGREPSYFSAKHFARNLQPHGLLIHDEEDEDTAVQNSKDIHSVWKNSHLVVTKGIGHNLRSKKIVSEVVDFITQPSITPKTFKSITPINLSI